MEGDIELEGLNTPMSRSLQAEGLMIQAAELQSGKELLDDRCLGVADAGKDLKRKNVRSRSKYHSETSKRWKAGNIVLDASNNRKRRGNGSMRRYQPAAKKSKRSLDSSAVSPKGTPLNLTQNELSENQNVYGSVEQCFGDDLDDSEPLINKITKNAAKFAQISYRRTLADNDSELAAKNTKHVSNSSQFPVKTTVPLSDFQILNKSVKRTLKPRRIPTDTAKDIATKSSRTVKKRRVMINNNGNGNDSNFSVRSTEDSADAAIAFNDLLVPNKTAKNAENRHKSMGGTSTTHSLSHNFNHKAQQNISGDQRGSTSKQSNNKAQQNRLVDVKTNTFKQGSRKSRKAFPDDTKTTTKQRGRKAISSPSHNVRLNVAGDEQHSLEQNAARTLSSRFSSHCDVFYASTDQQTPEQVTSSSLFTLPPHDQVSGLTASEKDKIIQSQSAGRVLRPRKQKQRCINLKRCYEEIALGDIDGFQILNRRIKVFWPLDDKWYYGVIKSYDPTNKLHYVRYDDHDEEWLSLQSEKFKLQLLPGEASGPANVPPENCGPRKGEGRCVEAIQSASEAQHQLNYDLHLATVDIDAFPHGTNNKSLEKSTSLPQAASFSSCRDGSDCAGPEKVNRLGNDTPNNSIDLTSGLAAGKGNNFKPENCAVNSNSSSDRRKSGNVYIRRRYHKISCNPICKDGHGNATEGEKASRLQKLDEPVKSCLSDSNLGPKSRDLCSGENMGIGHTKSLMSKSMVGPASISGKDFVNKDILECPWLGNTSEAFKFQRPENKDGPEIISASITDEELSIEVNLEHLRSGNDSESAKFLSTENKVEQDNFPASLKGKELSKGEDILHLRHGNGNGHACASITAKEFTNAQKLEHSTFSKDRECTKPLRYENEAVLETIPASITARFFPDGGNLENSRFDDDSEAAKSRELGINAERKTIPTSITGKEISNGENLEHSLFGSNSDPSNISSSKNKVGLEILPALMSDTELLNGKSLENTQFGKECEMSFELSPVSGKDLLNYTGLSLASILKDPDNCSSFNAVRGIDFPVHLKQPYYCPLPEPCLQYYNSCLNNDIKSGDVKDVIHHGFGLGASANAQGMDGVELASYSGFLKDLIISEVSFPYFGCSKELNQEDLNLLPLKTILPSMHSGTELPNIWRFSILALQQFGMMTAVWPNVHLDILVVDNFLGSELFSFWGSLRDAVNGFSMILASLSSPLKNQHFSMPLRDAHVPISSIRIHLTPFQGVGRALDFTFYNFQEMASAKWRELSRKLKGFCFFYKKSPLKKSPLRHCSNANSGILEGNNGQMSGDSVFGHPAMVVDDTPSIAVSDGSLCLFQPRASLLNGLQEMCDNLMCGPPFQKVIYKNKCKVSSSMPRRNVSGILLERRQIVPQFLLSFAAAPSFFISLNLKLLLGKPIGPTGFQSHKSELSAFENGLDFNLSKAGDGDSSFMQLSSKKVIQTIEGSKLQMPGSSLDEMGLGEYHTLGCNATRWLSDKHLKVDVDASSISTADGWVMSSPRSSYSELNVTGTAAGLTSKQDNHDSLVPGNVLKLRRCPTNRGSWRFAGSSRPNLVQGGTLPTTEFEENCSSHLHRSGEADATSSTSKAIGQYVRSHIESKQLWSTDPHPKPDQLPGYAEFSTAQGNIWKRDKFGTDSPSLGYRSQLWLDQGVQFYNGSIEPRKRRTGFSGHFFGENVDDFSFKSKCHARRGRPSRQNKEDKLKKNADTSSNLRMYLDSVTCIANILVVGVDRGWRESGAQVVLESSNHSDWMLSVKLSGITKYTHKAQQLVQTGTTNRYTHAMIWKGGKDWSLEFPDRKQWALFKELHEECYNRNLRAASVRHIPIPGVHQIDDLDSSSDAFPFVRPTSKYIRQVETEVEMALATSRVMYDMDSEDEEWLGHFNNSTGGYGGCQMNQVSEETFERVMDLLEKAAFTQQRELLNSDEVADFCWDIGPVEVVKAIHAHWQEKRWRKGMALVRYFQPASWERYQQQIKEWELLTNELQNSPTSNKQQLNLEKPPMFAFCLKPRGLEVPNKIQKQRSHRKFNGGQLFVLREQENDIFSATRRPNGDDASSDALGIMQSSPPQIEMYSQPGRLVTMSSEAATQLDSMDFTRKECKQKQKMKSRRKPKKMRIFVASKEPQRGISHHYLDRRKQFGSHCWETNSGGQWDDSPCFLSNKDNMSSMSSTYASAGSDFDAELRVQEATNATRAASELASVKRAKAQRLFQKADLALHKAVVAVVTAEAIQAAERDNQEANQLEVEKTQSEPVELCRSKFNVLAKNFNSHSKHLETSSATEQSVLPSLGHWQPSRLDPLGWKDVAVKSPNRFPSASLPTPSCLVRRMQVDVMPVTKEDSMAPRRDLDSKQGRIEESPLPNDALVPVSSWSQEFNVAFGTSLLKRRV
eukprot:Gb_25776 [translate_table: standard]